MAPYYRFCSSNFISYDNIGNLESYLYPNGVGHQYTYNPLNRLTNLTVSKVTSLASYTYDLGPAGNRTAVTELNGRKASYTYDDLYRLKEERIENDPASINGTIGYVYDPVGNRLSRTSTVAGIINQSFTYDANDRLNTDSYDDNGNTTGSDGKTYDYDFENHLTNQNGGGVVIIYDGDGNRVSKTVGGVTTQYLVDDRNHTGYAQVVEEIVNGTVERVYTYGLDLISQQQASGVSFYGYDGHGRVRLLTDANGAVTDTYDYDAFGKLIHYTGSTPNNYLYTGEQLDPNVGFYYLRARYYTAGSGRFLTMDTVMGRIKEPMSLHQFAYVHEDPVNHIDPSGHFALPLLVASVSILSDISIANYLNLKRDGFVFDKEVNEQLPSSGPGYYSYDTTGTRQYGRKKTIKALQKIGQAWEAAYPNTPIGIGEISVKGGGPFGKHKCSHMHGLDVDIRPMRDPYARNVANYKSEPPYSLALTQELVNTIDSESNPEAIIFNDSRVKDVTKLSGDTAHDNHLHIRFGRRSNCIELDVLVGESII